MSIYAAVWVIFVIIQTNQKKKHLPELKKYSMYTSGIFYVNVFFQFPKMP